MSWIRQVYPKHMSEYVPLDTGIRIQLVLDADAASVSNQTIVLLNLLTKNKTEIDCSYQQKIITIKPIEVLDQKTHYQVILLGGSDGIQFITGERLEKSYTFEFYTEENIALKPPIITSPANLSEINEKTITIAWQNAEGANHYELELSQSNTFDKLIWPIKPVKLYNNNVMPDISFKKGNYYVRMRSVASDGQKSAFTDAVQFFANVDLLHCDDAVDLLASQAIVPISFTSNPEHGTFHVNPAMIQTIRLAFDHPIEAADVSKVYLIELTN